MSEPVIEAHALVRHFGPVQAVRGIDLHASRGELVGLVGPDGGGKTTTLRMIAALMRPTSGSLRVLGEDPFARRSRVRERLGLVPQDHSLYGDLSIDENLRFFSSLFGLSRADFETRRERLMQITRLGQFGARRADQLSGGMYKKLSLACSLLHHPEVLLLDEPTNGVDPVSRRELWELVHQFLDEGMTVVVSTPYMDEAARCHRVLLVHEGRVLAEGPPGQLVQALPHPTFEVVGGERETLHALLASLPGVLAASPAGAELRIVVEDARTAQVREAIEATGARLSASTPGFEDLFLASVALARRAEHESERAA